MLALQPSQCGNAPVRTGALPQRDGYCAAAAAGSGLRAGLRGMNVTGERPETAVGPSARGDRAAAGGWAARTGRRPGPRRGQGAGSALRLLVEQLEVVVGAEVVDEVDGVGAGLDGQAEQVASAAGVIVDGLDRGLPAERGGLDDVPVAAVDGQDVAVGRDGQAEWAVQRAALGDGA